MVLFWKQIFICWQNFYKFTHVKYFLKILVWYYQKSQKVSYHVIKQVILCFADGPYLPTQHGLKRGCYH
jgi:hypothetical protein